VASYAAAFLPRTRHSRRPARGFIDTHVARRWSASPCWFRTGAVGERRAAEERKGRVPPRYLCGTWSATVQHHPGARSATPPHRRRGAAAARKGRVPPRYPGGTWSATVQHHPGARSATPPHRRRGAKDAHLRAASAVPGHRPFSTTPALGAPPLLIGGGEQWTRTSALPLMRYLVTDCSAPPRRSERHPSSSEEGSNGRAPPRYL
jgi:hypothetical protein